MVPARAGASGKGSGRLKLAPGGTRDARRGGERAVSSTALAGCGRGRDGRDYGWRRGFGAGASRGRSREAHASVTGPPPKSAAGPRYARSRPVRDLPCPKARPWRAFGHRRPCGVPYPPMRRFSDTAGACVVRKGRMATGRNHAGSFRGSKSPCGAHFEPRRFLTGRIPRSPSREDHGSPTSCRPCAAFPAKPSQVPGVSWRPQPARAATRRPGPISDGRNGLDAGSGQSPTAPQAAEFSSHAPYRRA